MRRRAALAGLAACAAVPAAGQSATLRGTAAYRERMALPPGAVLEVALQDISRADAPAETIAMVSLVAATQVPIAFALAYDPARIDRAHRYAVTGRLLAEGRTLFRTDTIHPVLTGGAGEAVELRLVQATAAPPVAARLVGPGWVVEQIGETRVAGRDRPTLTFTAEGRAYGFGGCNRFNGGYTLADEALEFGAIAATMMACAPPLAEREMQFFQALAAVRRWRLEGGALHLADAAGATLIRLLAAP